MNTVLLKQAGRKYHFRSVALYTTKKYIRDCVALAREGNHSAIRMMRMSRVSTPLGKEVWKRRVKARFDFVQRCMSDARNAKTEESE